MSKNTRAPKTIIIKYTDYRAASHTLIHSSALLKMLEKEYASAGVLAIGALSQVSTSIDIVISRLGLDDLDREDIDLPF